MGAKAICGGGGRASSQEQQADNRQQLSGGTLRGSVLLSTLGEYREQSKRRKRTLIFTFLASLLCQNTDTLVRRKGIASRAGKVSRDR